MSKDPYETPVLKKLGSVKDLTKGGTGNQIEPSGAGSFIIERQPT